MYLAFQKPIKVTKFKNIQILWKKASKYHAPEAGEYLIFVYVWIVVWYMDVWYMDVWYVDVLYMDVWYMDETKLIFWDLVFPL